jgi:hypothetical protein
VALPRLQLFELEDLPWFPRTIRDCATDYLRFVEARFALHQPLVPLLRQALDASSVRQVVDLCSGAGGPVAALSAALAMDGRGVHFTLTDKYPNIAAFQTLALLHEGSVSFVAESIEATHVPASLHGFRTMFNAFHHFAPRDAVAVLRSAVDAGEPIGVFEIPDRTIATLAPLLLTPLFVFAATPFIRPFLWRRMLWTYILPLVPATCWWDGLVSQMRAYTVSELEALARTAGGGYEWRAGRVPLGVTPGCVTYLIGIPSLSSVPPVERET